MTKKEKDIVYFILEHYVDDKQWVLDQVLRMLLGENEYHHIIRDFEDRDDAGNTRYEWSLGIEP